MTLENPVLLGVVGGAHGIRGEVRVKSYTQEPTDLGAYGPLADDRGNTYTPRSVREQKTVVVVKFDEVNDRNHAERLNGRELYVERALLPETEDAEEFYLDDLEGLAAVTTGGEALGIVVAVHNFGAGDILEIAPDDGATLMVPFSEAAVPELDLEAGVVTIDPVPAGLLDEGTEGTEETEAEGGDPIEDPSDEDDPAGEDRKTDPGENGERR